MDLSKYTLDKFQVNGRPIKPDCMCRVRGVKFAIAPNGATEVSWFANGEYYKFICSEDELRNKIAEIADAWIRDTKTWQTYHDALESYNKRRKEHEARLHEQFKIELFEELGITDNPKKDNLFSKAWELGHGGGYAEVYYHARDLVDLIA